MHDRVLNIDYLVALITHHAHPKSEGERILEHQKLLSSCFAHAHASTSRINLKEPATVGF